MWSLTADTVNAAIPLCRVLARRRWTLEGDRIMFDNDADLRDYNRHFAHIQALSAALARLQSAAQTRARAQIARMAR